MFDKYIDEFIKSEEMKSFLKMPHRSVDTIAEIIFYSPALVERKKIALMELLEELKQGENQELIENCETYLKYIQEAMGYIYADGVFSIEVCSYIDKNADWDYEFDGLFNNLDHLLECVHKNIEEGEITDEDPWLCQAVKWINDASGRLVEACTYWIVRGEIRFAEIDWKLLEGNIENVIALADLNLPVPFKAGDIVEVDLYPFADKRIIEIIEIGDNYDCCCLQALSRKIDGSWTIGAVKHGHIGNMIILDISPLYTMTAYDGELPPEHKILTKVSDFIDGKEENGAIFWNALSARSDITDEDILAFLDKEREIY